MNSPNTLGSSYATNHEGQSPDERIVPRLPRRLPPRWGPAMIEIDVLFAPTGSSSATPGEQVPSARDGAVHSFPLAGGPFTPVPRERLFDAAEAPDADAAGSSQTAPSPNTLMKWMMELQLHPKEDFFHLLRPTDFSSYLCRSGSLPSGVASSWLGKFVHNCFCFLILQPSTFLLGKAIHATANSDSPPPLWLMTPMAPSHWACLLTSASAPIFTSSGLCTSSTQRVSSVLTALAIRFGVQVTCGICVL